MHRRRRPGQHERIAARQVGGRDGAPDKGGTDREEVADFVGKDPHLLGQALRAANCALTHEIQVLHRAVGGLEQALVRGKVLLLAMTQKIVHIGSIHLRKRRMLHQVLPKITQQAW